MRVHVAFTPDEVFEAPVAVVVDVMRATSTIAQALASGYRRVYCCREVSDALALREMLGEGLLGGERKAVRIEGFDIGASPREVLEPRGEVLIYSTTNGTRAVLAAAEGCGTVLLGSLLNLDAVAGAVRDDCVIVCAGFQGAFALDDAYCAGRIVDLLDGEVTDAAKGSAILAHSFPIRPAPSGTGRRSSAGSRTTGSPSSPPSSARPISTRAGSSASTAAWKQRSSAPCRPSAHTGPRALARQPAGSPPLRPPTSRAQARCSSSPTSACRISSPRFHSACSG